jgi:hypothetical protein
MNVYSEYAMQSDLIETHVEMITQLLAYFLPRLAMHCGPPGARPREIIHVVFISAVSPLTRLEELQLTTTGTPDGELHADLVDRLEYFILVGLTSVHQVLEFTPFVWTQFFELARLPERRVQKLSDSHRDWVGAHAEGHITRILAIKLIDIEIAEFFKTKAQQPRHIYYFAT